MTEKQKNSYIELLNIVNDDTMFLADMAQRISAHVTSIRERIAKIKAELDGEP